MVVHFASSYALSVILTCHCSWQVSAVWQSDPILSGSCPLLLTFNHAYSLTLFPGSHQCLATFTVTQRKPALTDKETCCSLTVIASKLFWEWNRFQHYMYRNRL